MQAPLLHKLKGQNLWLSALRSVFWEEEKTLVVSDLHFGKTGHFRKAGIAIPQNVYKEDLQRLVSLLHHFGPRKLIVVGDFFHSHANVELDLFKKWRQDFASLEIELVMGNHDILHSKWYQEAGVKQWEKDLLLSPFYFTHEHCETHPDAYTFCGHIHPGIILNGLGKQSLRFPCFYFGADHCILPAFSRFTGMYTIVPQKTDKVFALVEQSIISLQ
jgi:DNA ligase-associated metallophosphoesterase